MRSGAGCHLRRQKDHEDARFNHGSVFDGDADGHLPELRPTVRQVCHDCADAVGLLRIVVPSEDTGPHVKLVGSRRHQPEGPELLTRTC